MMRLSKFGTATVLGLVLGLAIFTTGVFAQGASQSIDHNNISVSAHAAVVNSVMQSTARGILAGAIQRPSGARDDCGNWGWGNGCGGFGGGNRFGGCGGWNNCFRPRPVFRCSFMRECRTIQVCRWTSWGRVCQGRHICRERSIFRRGFDFNGWGGGVGPWGVKKR